MKPTILFITILIVVGTCSAIQFDLPRSVLKCFKENYKKGQAVHGDVYPVNDDKSGINFYIESPSKKIVYRNDMMSGKYAFTVDETGPHSFCFMDQYSTYRRKEFSRRIEFTSSLVEDDDERDVKLDEEIKPIEKKILKLEKVAIKVENEAWSYQTNEAIHRALSDTLNFRVSWLSILTIFTILGLAFSQVFYLQKYLKKTKYID